MWILLYCQLICQGQFFPERQTWDNSEFYPKATSWVSLSWLPEPGVSEIPWLFPDKCKISLTNWINNFTHQTWWWTQPSPRNHLLHIFIYAFSKSGAVYIRVFSYIWKYRIQRFSWQTHAAGEMLSARVKNF